MTVSENISFEEIQLVLLAREVIKTKEETPNDMELGKKVRQIINAFE